MKWMLFTLVCMPALLNAQSTAFPLHSRQEAIIDRLMVTGMIQTPMHPEVRGYARRDQAQMLLDSTRMNTREAADWYYLFNDNNDWQDSVSMVRSSRPLLKYFYRTPANLFEVNTRHFNMRLNPVLNVAAGQDIKADDKLVYYNQRGVEVRAAIDNKVYLCTSFLETQTGLPKYVSDWYNISRTVPGTGFYKGYSSSVLNIRNGYDYNIANAMIGFQATKHIGVQFGHGQQFIGNGYRSMLLSDWAPPMFFLKLNTRVWKFHYQNLFMELAPVAKIQVPNDGLLPKKYVAAHYLNFQPTPNFAIGLFETTVLNRSRQFELQYLNPVILYRTVEGVIGSKDNVLLGLNARWNLLRRFQLYGQLMLDEFLLKEIRAQNGWWANKYGYQAGIKYVNVFGIDHLDAQFEYNAARPYLYSHRDSFNSYTHYNHSLAHPLGANFRETVFLLRYQPTANLFFNARLIQMETGEDPYLKNYGGNILLGSDSREADYDNTIGQGIATRIRLIGLDASWMFRHNMFLDIRLLLRQKNSDDALLDAQSQIFTAGVRVNFWPQTVDF